MPLILGTNSIKDTGFDVANSCRFSAASSDSLSRTLGSGNQKTFTISLWFKPSKINFTDGGGGADREVEKKVAEGVSEVEKKAQKKAKKEKKEKKEKKGKKEKKSKKEKKEKKEKKKKKDKKRR